MLTLVNAIAALSLPLLAGATAQDTVRMRVTWEVTPGVHATADSLGEISGLALDANGNVYASDFNAERIWVFDRQGRSRPPVGRKGDGPGEYQAPTGLGIDRRGRLVVRDISRVTYYTTDPRTGTLARYDTSFAGPAMTDWRSKRASRFSTSNDLLYPGGENRFGRDGSQRIFLFRYAPSGTLRDTALAVPNYPTRAPRPAFVQTSPGGGRMLPGLNQVPFAPMAVWDVTPEGTVISGDGTSYALRETDAAGRVIQTFSRSIPATPIAARERQDSLAALRQRLDTLPVPISQAQGIPDEVRQLRVPSHYPPYRGVYVADDGRVWVYRWTTATRNESVFDVFSRSGTFQQTVVLPRRILALPTPVITTTTVIGVVVDPDTDEQGVVRFDRP